MSTPVEVLEAEAMKLTPEERAPLADRLISSLSADADADADADAEIEEAWAVEVERRIAEIEAGRAPVVPAADAIARARDALK